MNYVTIDYYLYTNLLTIKVLEKLFIALGKLEPGSFNIAQLVATDNSIQTVFIYPTDFDSSKAHELVNKIVVKVSKLSIKKIHAICNPNP